MLPGVDDKYSNLYFLGRDRKVKVHDMHFLILLG